jgi:hypothetical protein
MSAAGEPVFVQRLDPPQPGWIFSAVNVAGSPTRLVAATRLDGQVGTRILYVESEVLGGSWGSPLTAIRPKECATAENQLRSVDVSADTIAYRECERGDPAVIDFAAQPPVAESYPGEGLGLRIAGRFMAWLENPQLGGRQADFSHRYDMVVYDRQARSVVLRLPAAAMEGGVHSFDVQDDGKVALSFAPEPGAGDGRMRVAWASPAEPALHVLTLPPMPSYEVRIANDSIGFEAGDTTGDGTDIALARLGVSDLNGNERVLAANGEDELRSEGFDFDGKQLAWWSYGCSHALVHVVSSDSKPDLSARRHGCALRFSARPRVVDGARAVRLRVDCFGFVACSVPRIVLAGRGRGRPVLGKGREGRVKLTRSARDKLRRRGRLDVRVTATITDVAGRREDRRARVVLR